MALLHLLSYAGGLAAFLFVTLSLASGLLWLAELIEEHSRYAKTIGMRAIYAVIGLHIVLFFTDSLPVMPTALGITAHLVYLSNFSSTWPFISLTSIQFLASCVLVVADHFAWFYHFAAKANEAKRYRTPKYRYGGGHVNEGPAFMDVAAFFAICVWFVPLFLFLSLSANDNALPSFDASAPPSPILRAHGAIDLSTPPVSSLTSRNGSGRRAGARTSLVKSILSPVLSLLPGIRGRTKKNEEGIIAPRTPVRGSPLHSPVPMPNMSYFPWGNESSPPTNNSNLSSMTDMRNRARTPPPPRRVQSDAQVSHAMNPRGIATRNGVPAFESEEEKLARINSPVQEDDAVRMSLGGNGRVVGQVLESIQPGRRKND